MRYTTWYGRGIARKYIFLYYQRGGDSLHAAALRSALPRHQDLTVGAPHRRTYRCRQRDDCGGRRAASFLRTGWQPLVAAVWHVYWPRTPQPKHEQTWCASYYYRRGVMHTQYEKENAEKA